MNSALENVINGEKALQHIVFIDNWAVGDLVIKKLHSDIHYPEPLGRNLLQHPHADINCEYRIQAVGRTVGLCLAPWYTKIIIGQVLRQPVDAQFRREPERTQLKRLVDRKPCLPTANSVQQIMLIAKRHIEAKG